MSSDITKDPNLLREELYRAHRELQFFFEISNLMRMTLELDHILYIILTCVTAHEGLGFNRAVLFLVNKKERVLEGKMLIGPESPEEAGTIWKKLETERPNLERLSAAYNVSKKRTAPLNQAIQNLRIPLSKEEGGFLAQAVADGEPLHLKKNAIQQRPYDPLFQVFKTNEVLIMPLKAKDKVNGLIVVDNLYTQKAITQDDMKIFTMLTNQAGLAIENSQLYEMVVHKSHTDSLTSLWNHGFFQDTLGIKIENARTEHMPIGLAIIDVDNFKIFNDLWGHRNGDLILQEMANILKDLSREEDYVCRYGGEEFAIILTAINKEQAALIAERIREHISNYQFRGFTAKEPFNITVSIGIASFPQDASNKEELIFNADKAMYTAKFTGKNKTCVAESRED